MNLNRRPKHSPATPLPWARMARSPKSISGDHNVGAVLKKVAHVLNQEDRAYIEHACNAYPRLVAALQYAANRLCADKDQPQVELDMRAILRDLGEEA